MSMGTAVPSKSRAMTGIVNGAMKAPTTVSSSAKAASRPRIRQSAAAEPNGGPDDV